MRYHVMIGNDHIDSGPICRIDSLMAAGAAIGCNNEIDVVDDARIADMTGLQPISFSFSVWNVVGDPSAGGSQKFGDQNGIGNPIHIVISKNKDAFLPQGGIMDAADSHTHVFHGGWIRHLVKRGSQKMLCQRWRVNPPVRQK